MVLSSLLVPNTFLVAVDAKQKGVKLAAHYAKFVDLVSEFSRTYPRLAKLGGGGGSTSLHKMADQLDVAIGEERPLRAE